MWPATPGWAATSGRGPTAGDGPPVAGRASASGCRKGGGEHQVGDRDARGVRSERGSIPALSHLEDHGVVDTSAVIGLAQPRDRAHGPEESIDLRRLSTASEIVFDLLRTYGTVGPGGEGRP